MSYISTEDIRDEQADKEAEEFDFDYAYVFGNQARYKIEVSPFSLSSLTRFS